MTITNELIADIQRIVSIPEANSTIEISNGTEILTDKGYLNWRDGYGQALLPLLLAGFVLFCVVCCIFHGLLYILVAIIKKIRENYDEENNETPIDVVSDSNKPPEPISQSDK